MLVIWAPLSEVFGRRNLFVISYFFHTLWTGVTIASPNFASILVFRFLAGAFGSSPLSNAGGVIADVFSAEQRGLGLALFASAPFMGPALGPIIGGFLGESLGWRAVFIFLTIFSGVIFLVGCVLMPETYAARLLRQRALMLSKATGHHYLARIDKGKDVSIKTQFSVGIIRPWKLLFTEPIVLMLSLYTAIIYATLYSLFAAFPIVFQQGHGWSPGIGGLAFIGALVGIIFGLVYTIVFENPRYVRISRKHGGFAPPEARLHSAKIAAPCLVVGLVWFAASCNRETFWLVPILGTVPFGFGMVLVFLSLQTYLIDAYVIYAASVLAANSLLRSLFGFAWPLFTPTMYENLGVRWGASVAAFLAFACLPMPYLFAHYGAGIRKKCKFAAEADQVMQLMQHRAHAGGAAEEKKKIDDDEHADDSTSDAAHRTPSAGEKSHHHASSTASSDLEAAGESRSAHAAAPTSSGKQQ